MVQENEGEGTIVEEFEIEYDAADVPEGDEGDRDGAEGETAEEGTSKV